MWELCVAIYRKKGCNMSVIRAFLNIPLHAYCTFTSNSTTTSEIRAENYVLPARILLVKILTDLRAVF